MSQVKLKKVKKGRAFVLYPVEILDWARRFANVNGMTLTEVMHEALTEYQERNSN